jgi:hypothetical protein
MHVGLMAVRVLVVGSARAHLIPRPQVRGVGAMMPVVSQLGAIATVAMNVMLTLRTTAGETSV